MPVGIVIRRKPGSTRWSKWVWSAVAVIPGADEAHWRVLREEGDITDFHAATVPLEVYRTDTQAYLTALSDKVPSLYVVLRESADADNDKPFDVVTVTASSYEGQDYADTGEEIVEKVPMPPGLIAWIRTFVEQHHEDEKFIKRRRDQIRVDQVQDGIGDRRIKQLSDVYRAPNPRNKERLQ